MKLKSAYTILYKIYQKKGSVIPRVGEIFYCGGAYVCVRRARATFARLERRNSKQFYLRGMREQHERPKRRILCAMVFDSLGLTDLSALHFPSNLRNVIQKIYRRLGAKKNNSKKGEYVRYNLSAPSGEYIYEENPLSNLPVWLIQLSSSFIKFKFIYKFFFSFLQD